MRSFLRTLMLTVALAVCCGTVCAQKSDRQKRLTREELAEKQARHIAGVMTMDDATTSRFVETYCKCQKEIWALGPRRGKGARRGAQAETEAESEQAIKARFEHSRKILDIRQKYYEEYSKFLTQKQIKQVYEIERRMMNRLAKRKGNGLHNGNRRQQR